MKNFRKIMALLLALSMIFMFVACNKTDNTSGKDNSWDKIKEKGKLVVGMCAMYPPFESRNAENGEIEGFDLDFMRKLGEYLGVEVEFKDAEYVALIGGLGTGNYDVLCSGIFREEVATGKLQGSDTYYNIDTVAVVLNKNNSINSLKDLDGKVIGVQSGTYAEKLVDEKIKNVKEIKRYNYSAEGFTDLRAGRMEAFIVGHTFASEEEKKHGKHLRIVPEPLGQSELIIMSREGELELNKKLNEGIAKVKENKDLDKIVEKWIDNK